MKQFHQTSLHETSCGFYQNFSAVAKVNVNNKFRSIREVIALRTSTVIIFLLMSFVGNAQIPTATVVSSDANPACEGVIVTLTATVTPSAATGNVEFFDGVTSLGIVALTGGTADLPISTLTTGVHTITANYFGDGTYEASDNLPGYGLIITEAPIAPVATAGSGATCSQITANWNASADATTYFLDVATDAAFTVVVSGYNNLNVTNVTTYSVSGLTAGVIYYYRVRAENSCGTSSNSNSISYATLPAAPLAPVATAGTGATCNQITANWNASTDATAYFLDVATDAGFTAFVPGYNNATVGNVLTEDVTGLTAGVTYYYRVRANNSCGTSANSNSISYATLTAAPLAPVATAGTGATCNQITANWNASPDATAYFLDVATDAGFTVFVPGYNNANVGNILTETITGLTAGVTYYYRVRANNTCGTSSNSNVITYATLPATPAAPVATAGSGATCSQITANWNASTDATAYFLDVATDAGFTVFVPGYNNANVGNILTETITGLTAGVTYYYRVRANNICGTSANSNAISYVTLPAAPLAPVATAGSGATCSQITANWNVSADATAYFLDVATDAAFTVFVPGYNDLNVGNVLTETITGLVAGVTYYYRVRANNICGTSANSNAISYVTLPAAPLAPVATAGSGATCSQITANWNVSADATDYFLDVATDAAFTVFVPGYNDLNVGNVLTETITGLVAGVTYYYRVRANNICGTSANSNAISYVTLPAAPLAPVATAGSGATCSQITANWNASVNATSYIIDVATDAGFTVFVPGYSNTNVGNITTINITGLTAGVTYYYRVRANNSCGTSGNSNAITHATLPATPTAPVATAGTGATCNQITVNWNASANATSYILDVATDAAFTVFVAGYNNINVGNVLTRNVTGLTAGVTYYYRVRANNTCGTSSNSNVTTYATLPAAPIAPLATAGTGATCSQITANWNTSANATAYFLDVATDAAFTIFVAGYNNANVGNVLTRNVTGLTAGVTYYYRVRANNTCGTGANSNVISYATLPATPAAPVATAGTGAGCTQITANWNISVNSSAYFLDVATNSTFTVFVAGYNNLNVGNVTTRNITGLTAGVTYYYRVRANNSCGTSANSNVITYATSPATPATPGTISGTTPQCPSSPGQVYSIGAVTNATTYTWTVPGGWTITGGNGTISITVTTGTAGQNGNISVTAGNSCGTSSARNLAVTVNTPPSISGQPANKVTCAGTAQTFTVTASGTSLIYQWQYSADGSTGWTNVGTNIPAVGYSYTGASNATVTVNSPTGAVNGIYYYRCVINNGSGCSITANSNAASLTVSARPTATAGADQTPPCGTLTTTLAANTPVSPATGTWTIVSGGIGVFGNANSPTSTFTGTPGSIYTLRWTVSNGVCTNATDDVTIQFNYNLSGIYSVGGGTVAGEAGHFNTLTRAIDNYNTCLGGNVTFVLTDATYNASTETFPLVLSNATGSVTRTLTIKPNTGINTTITTGTNTSASATLQLNGADYVTIDGDNGSGSRNLTIVNTSTLSLIVPFTSVIWISSSSSTGATNNAIKNCNISGSGKTTTWAGINSGDNSSPVNTQADFPNNNNTIQNCSFANAVHGAYVYGAATKDQSWTISSNIFTSGYGSGINIQYAQTAIIYGNTISNIDADAGINGNTTGIEVVGNSTTVTISSNNISNITNTGALLSGNTDGIRIGATTQGFSITGNTISNISSTSNASPAIGVEIYGAMSGTNAIAYNKIWNISQSYTLLGAYYGAEGIYLNTSGTPTISVYNNFISNVVSAGNNTSIFNTNVSGYNENGYGIMVDAGTGYKIYYNSVNLVTNQNRGLSAAINIAGDDGGVPAGAVDLRDNIFANNQTGGASAATRYSIYCGAANTVFSNINYNDYYNRGTHLGFLGSNRTTLANIQTWFGGNLNSQNIIPVFLSATDLHLDPANNVTLDNLGTPITGIIDDIDIETRSTATPDIGADEFNACSSSIYTWIGVDDNNWNNPLNWCTNNGTVPPITGDVVIPAGTPFSPEIYTGAAALAKTLKLNAGATLTMSSSQVLNIDAGFDVNGTFTAGDGTVNFIIPAAPATLTGNATTFNNISTDGNLTLSAIPTINGSFTINSGQVLSNSPIYTSNSTLIYNTTGAYTTGVEWNNGAAGTTAPGSGIPQNVIIQDGIITIPDALGANRAIAGDLIINSGKTMQMTTGTRDLYILGNWTNNGGTFNANGRTVDFNAPSVTPKTQTINGITTFYNLTFGNANITTDFSTSATTVTNQFNNNDGTMDGNTSTVILTGSGPGTIIGGAAKNFYNLQINNGAVINHTTGGGLIHIANSFVNDGTLNEGTGYTLYFDKSGATETFTGAGTANLGNITIGDGAGLSVATTLNASANFTVNGGSFTFYHGSVYDGTYGTGGTVTFSLNSATIISSGPALATASFHNATTNVNLDLGNGISTIYNILQLNTGGRIINNDPVYGPASTLIYNMLTAPNFLTDREWKNSLGPIGPGAPFNVTVQNAGNIVMNGPWIVPGILTVTPNANLYLNDHLLAVRGSFSGTGVLNGSVSSGLIVNTSSDNDDAGTVYFAKTRPFNQLKTLILSSGELGLGGSLLTGDSLNIVGGNSIDGYGRVIANGLLKSNGIMTLLSDADGTAQVGQSYGTITGDVTVQRYYPSHLAWRFIGVPFSSTSQSIKDAWQEGYTDVVLQCPPQYTGTPGYGTAITFDNTNGYDVHNNNYRTSMQVYQNNMWVTPSGTTSNLVTTTGSSFPAYSLFVRGDRSVCLTGIYPSTATTLRPRGVLNQFAGAPVAHNLPAGVSGDYALIGNPYAATVDIDNIIRTAPSGIYTDRFWVWNPKLAGTKGYGSYVAFSLTGGIFTPDNTYTGGTNIQSGQAFMVQRNSSGAAALSFNETDKVAFQDVDVFGIKAARLKPAAVFINLVNTNMELLDGVGASLNNKFAAGVDSLDIPKLWNAESEKVALVRDERPLAIELMPVPKKADTLFVRLYLRQEPYKLQIYSRNLPLRVSKAWVVDKYLNTQTPVDLRDTTFYDFVPNTDTNSYRNRFMLVFNPKRPAWPAGIDSLISKIKARIYPNPVSGKAFNLALENAIAGDYTVNIFTTGGKLVATRKISYQDGSGSSRIPLPATIAAGHYVVQILNEDKIVIGSIPLIISK